MPIGARAATEGRGAGLIAYWGATAAPRAAEAAAERSGIQKRARCDDAAAKQDTKHNNTLRPVFGLIFLFKWRHETDERAPDTSAAASEVFFANQVGRCRIEGGRQGDEAACVFPQTITRCEILLTFTATDIVNKQQATNQSTDQSQPD